MSDLRVGAKLPNNETVLGPAQLRAFAQGIERLGFDHLSIDDHVSTAPAEKFSNDIGATARVRARHEIFTTIAWLAGLTTTLEFRTGILILPQRQTVLVARQAAEVDVLSNGRLTLGVGLGWNPLEFEVMGETFARRAKRLQPQIDVLRKLWTEEFVTVSDGFHEFDRVGVLPRPVQQPIPVWIGAQAIPAIQRAARIADGFMSLGRIGDGAEQQIAAYVTERARLGLDSAPLNIEGWIDLADGDASSWSRQAETWRYLGASHLTLVSSPDPVVSIEAHLSLLEKGLMSLQY